MMSVDWTKRGTEELLMKMWRRRRRRSFFTWELKSQVRERGAQNSTELDQHGYMMM